MTKSESSGCLLSINFKIYGVFILSNDSGQKFIKRNRPPRVQISYDSPYEGEPNVELPFVMGVMADLSGNASTTEKDDMEERDFTDVDMDNINAYMSSIEPAISFQVSNKLGEKEDESFGVRLQFNSMDDFEPSGVVRQIPALNELLEAREQLANLQRYMDGKSAAADQIKNLLKDPDLMNKLNEKRTKSIEENNSVSEDD